MEDKQLERQRKAYIKCVERLIRTSLEYNHWADEERSKVKECPECHRQNDGLVEFHCHHWPTLYDIVNDNLKDLSKHTLVLAEETLKQHLDGQVEFKVLCSCCHQRFHSLQKQKD